MSAELVSVRGSAEPRSLVASTPPVELEAGEGRLRGLVAAWLASLRSAHTHRAYAGDMLAWFGWCAGSGVDPLTARRVHVGAWARLLEGLVAKRTASRYAAGRSLDWVKVRNTRRVVAVVTGATRGTSSRAATFGALRLALLDADGAVVALGEVGGGFTRA